MDLEEENLTSVIENKTWQGWGNHYIAYEGKLFWGEGIFQLRPRDEKKLFT